MIVNLDKRILILLRKALALNNSRRSYNYKVIKINSYLDKLLFRSLIISLYLLLILPLFNNRSVIEIYILM